MRRSVYGKPIAALQHWQFRLAEHALDVATARSLYQKAGLVSDAGHDASVLAAMSKIKGSALAVDVARDAVQGCGGYRFVRRLAGQHEALPPGARYPDAPIAPKYQGGHQGPE